MSLILIGPWLNALWIRVHEAGHCETVSVHSVRVDSLPRALPDRAECSATFDSLGVKRAGPLLKIGQVDVPSTCLN